MVLPDGTGLELVDQVLFRDPDLAIMLGSGYVDSRSRQEAIRERGLFFVQKPYILTELLQAVRAALDIG